jgi:hypothetical protein
VTVVEGRAYPRGVFGIDALLVGWAGLFYGPELFGFRGVAYGQNLLVWPSIVASWVFACKKWRIAAAIAGLCTIGLVSISPTLGPIGYPGSLGYAAWLANPVIAIAWILYLGDKQPSALISAIVSLGLTLSFLWIQEGPFGLKLHDAVPIVSYGIGYWLWVASAALLASGACAGIFLFRSASTAGRQYIPPM